VKNDMDDLHGKIELVVGISFIRHIDRYRLRGWKIVG
jgi:hypothetical protein